MRNYGERLPFRGGRWGFGSRAGVFALCLFYARSYSDSGVGFRAAFIRPPSQFLNTGVKALAEELKVLQKTYDMIQYGYICLRQYPKSEKHTLAAETKRAMFELLKSIIMANRRYYKKNAIQEG